MSQINPRLNRVIAAFGYTFERIDKNNTVLLIVDHQVGLFNLVKNYDPVQFKNNVLAHAEIAKVFSLPTVITSSSETGPNGPILKEILDLHPDAPLIKRPGEVDAWDNVEFRAAVNATGKTQVIIASIATDVCTAFLALSLREAGYTVFHNSQASGTYSERVAKEANDRMRDAGVQNLSLFAIAADLMRDWRSTPGAPELIPFFDKYFPEYGVIARSYNAARGQNQV
ncbi:hypothetical protein PQX77_007282 [Marasmius sp. AFHP31]|nr:hypothetical protein PQX77_007282 [Marasmius sp. AFHP31]